MFRTSEVCCKVQKCIIKIHKPVRKVSISLAIMCSQSETLFTSLKLCNELVQFGIPCENFVEIDCKLGN